MSCALNARDLLARTCRLHDNGVDLKRRPPKSLPTAPRSKNCSFDRGSGPQGLRRPRFSFFRFTCQTARDRGGPTLSVEPESRRSSRPPTEIGCLVTVSVRSFEGAPSHRKADGAPYGRYIGAPPHRCQHLKTEKFALSRRMQRRQLSTRLRHVDIRRASGRAWTAAAQTPHWSHIPRTYLHAGGRCQFGGSAPSVA